MTRRLVVLLSAVLLHAAPAGAFIAGPVEGPLAFPAPRALPTVPPVFRDAAPIVPIGSSDNWRQQRLEYHREAGKLAAERSRELSKAENEYFRELDKARRERDRELADGKPPFEVAAKYRERVADISGKLLERVNQIEASFDEHLWDQRRKLRN